MTYRKRISEFRECGKAFSYPESFVNATNVTNVGKPSGVSFTLKLLGNLTIERKYVHFSDTIKQSLIQVLLNIMKISQEKETECV